MISERWQRVSLGALALINVAIQSLNPPRSDDLTYLRWAAERVWDPWTPMFRPAPFPGWRPANNLAWWLSVSLEGTSAILPQVVLALLWLVAFYAAYRWVSSRWGAQAGLIAAGVLLTTDRFRDLVNWRSWLTTTGELAGIALCLWAMESKRWGAAILAGAVATWFKEPAVLPLMAAAVFVYSRPTVAIGVAAAGLPGAMKAFLDARILSGHLPSLAEEGARVAAYLITLGGWVWPASVVVLAALGRGSGLSAELRWVAPMVAAILPALLYSQSNPTYLLECTLFAIGPAAAVLSLPANRRVLLATLAISLASVPATLLNARYQALQLVSRVNDYDQLDPASVLAFRLSQEANEAAVWYGLRLRYDDGVPERPALSGGEEVVPGLFVVRGQGN